MKEATLRAQKLGHAVLKVRSLALSVPFYRDVLGLTEVARYGAQMAFFSCGDNHHDLALLDPTHATVEFVARYKLNGRAFRLHETSRFERVDGRWLYVDGEVRE